MSWWIFSVVKTIPLVIGFKFILFFCFIWFRSLYCLIRSEERVGDSSSIGDWRVESRDGSRQRIYRSLSIRSLIFCCLITFYFCLASSRSATISLIVCDSFEPSTKLSLDIDDSLRWTYVSWVTCDLFSSCCFWDSLLEETTDTFLPNLLSFLALLLRLGPFLFGMAGIEIRLVCFWLLTGLWILEERR